MRAATGRWVSVLFCAVVVVVCAVALTGVDAGAGAGGRAHRLARRFGGGASRPSNVAAAADDAAVFLDVGKPKPRARLNSERSPEASSAIAAARARAAAIERAANAAAGRGPNSAIMRRPAGAPRSPRPPAPPKGVTAKTLVGGRHAAHPHRRPPPRHAPGSTSRGPTPRHPTTHRFVQTKGKAGAKAGAKDFSVTNEGQWHGVEGDDEEALQPPWADGPDPLPKAEVEPFTPPKAPPMGFQGDGRFYPPPPPPPPPPPSPYPPPPPPPPPGGAGDTSVEPKGSEEGSEDPAEPEGGDDAGGDDAGGGDDAAGGGDDAAGSGGDAGGSGGGSGGDSGGGEFVERGAHAHAGRGRGHRRGGNGLHGRNADGTPAWIPSLDALPRGGNSPQFPFGLFAAPPNGNPPDHSHLNDAHVAGAGAAPAPGTPMPSGIGFDPSHVVPGPDPSQQQQQHPNGFGLPSAPAPVNGETAAVMDSFAAFNAHLRDAAHGGAAAHAMSDADNAAMAAAALMNDVPKWVPDGMPGGMPGGDGAGEPAISAIQAHGMQEPWLSPQEHVSEGGEDSFVPEQSEPLSFIPLPNDPNAPMMQPPRDAEGMPMAEGMTDGMSMPMPSMQGGGGAGGMPAFGSVTPFPDHEMMMAAPN